ncbi:MAG: ATP-dependent metallopeptidase FtsH/Yme1/Tma family protein [Chloroflexi bacterium]|nr:ATP-dependent metallopeptidase FtsH/Yme1/Tma family protein [Chloroflexota bacterium]MYA49783.1 ATP-dependent metallopeptidase FtsH/Yme1/Tma family protein [Chloroflexota bacterium]MYB83747.1 ATP-dependent metallopeptidase FtsH/Yme1/Tma family protein [Chloroflexota bacterium]MYF65814.1 ATP-dependent metallopeptidase FtsH/Yme1/Tma family protein [Chloroflexota bacterium]MYK35803.1 ATP-dependent metallopeptidase FtsH/Yme1/Tma family protein [Chloroflexota bacterium]
MGNRWIGNTFIYLIIFVAVIAVFFMLFSPGDDGEQSDLTSILALAKNGQISSIVVDGDRIVATSRQANQQLVAAKEPGTSIFEILQTAGIDPVERGIEVEVHRSGGLGNLFGILLQFLPLIFFGAILLFMMRQAQGSNNQALGFGKSRARMNTGNRPTVMFSDVAGVEESKTELQEVVEFLKYPERFLALGAHIPKGVLMVGPPGIGKTLLSKAVAGEAGVPFFSISGSEFVEMFVGVGASRVRDLFDQAKRNAPSIVFVDEIDAVGRHRGAGLGGGHDEREQTLNQILVEMDGFETSTNVIVIAATNRPDILDPALLRPGRFDRRVVLDLPDINGRVAILEVHCKGKPLGDDVNLERLARQTPGFSGADLANLVNEAAILAARRSEKTVSMSDMLESIDRVTMGPERRTRVISQKEKEIVAYHEGGHALVGHLLEHGDPVQKISIVSRGMAAGYTKSLPEEDRMFYSRPQLIDRITMALGGRVAEEITFNEVTTGASNDLEQVTQIARAMVTRYGMSESLLPRTFGKREEMVFLGREISEMRDYSEKVAQEIDEEVQSIVVDAYHTAKRLLLENYPKLVQIARYLMLHESIEGPDLEQLFSSEAPPLDGAVPVGA